MKVDGVKIKDIPDFSDYAISTDGRVWSKSRRNLQGALRRGRWLKKLPPDHSGHYRFRLYRNGNNYQFCIHTLVLMTYKGPRPEGMVCRHLDGNPENNDINNLCWGTQSENQQDAVRHGTSPGFQRRGISCSVGVKNPAAKLTESDVRMIIYIHRTGLFSPREIGKQFGVGRTTVNDIIHKKRWKHLWAA